MKSKLAIWSFISVIVIIILGFLLGDLLYVSGIIWIFWILYAVPLVLGILGLVDIRKNKLEGKSLAIIGIILAALLYLVNLVAPFF